jgi:hypothetical protein
MDITQQEHEDSRQLEGTCAVSIVENRNITGILPALCLLFLLLTAVAALSEIAGLAMCMSCGVITVVLIVEAGALLLYLKRRAQRFRPVSVRTLHTVKEDANG